MSSHPNNKTKTIRDLCYKLVFPVKPSAKGFPCYSHCVRSQRSLSFYNIIKCDTIYSEVTHHQRSYHVVYHHADMHRIIAPTMVTIGAVMVTCTHV